MFRLFYAIFFLVVISCTSTSPKIDSDSSSNHGTDLSNTPTEWGLVLPKQWEVQCTVEFVLDRGQNLKTSMSLLFEAERDPQGVEHFRFREFLLPAYTRISYKTGLFPRISHTDIRSQVAQEKDAGQALSVATSSLAEFQQTLGFDSNHEKKEDIVFVVEGGSFQFSRSAEGSVKSATQEMKTRYQYQNPTESPVDFNANIFPALEQALKFLSQIPLKSSKLKTILALESDYTWSEKTTDLVQKVADTAIAINPKLSFVINRETKQETEWKWTVSRQTAEMLETSATLEPFELSLQNYTFQMQSCTRKTKFYRKQCYVLEDTFEIDFKGKEAPQQIKMFIQIRSK
ncbi:MAG: hypothetical protein AABZ60_21310 [Planctomycetota bacterium]